MARALLRLCRMLDKPDLRERLFLQGPERLSDVDLLTVIVGAGHRTMSARAQAVALYEEQGLLGLKRQRPRALVKNSKLGPAGAARLLAAIELGRRVSRSRCNDDNRPRFDGPRDVEAWANPWLTELGHEEVWLLCLDGHHRLSTESLVARGGASGCVLSPRDILRPALCDGAQGFVMVHNHPSGDPTPSPADVETTVELARAARATGLGFIDHVIVAAAGASSLRELGVLDQGI